MFRPYIITNVIIHISNIHNISMLLLLRPLFVNSFCQLNKCFLQIFKVIIVVREHKVEIPFQLSCITIEIVFVHVFGLLLLILLELLRWCWFIIGLILWWLLWGIVVIGGLLVIWGVLIVRLVCIFRIVVIMLRLHSTIQNIIF